MKWTGVEKLLYSECCMNNGRKESTFHAKPKIKVFPLQNVYQLLNNALNEKKP